MSHYTVIGTMQFVLSSPDLCDGLSDAQKAVLQQAQALSDPVARWDIISKRLLTPKDNWQLHKELYESNYKNCEVAPAWIPSSDAAETNIGKMMRERSITDYNQFYQWSINSSEEFWDACIKEIDIKFDAPYTSVFEMSRGVKHIEYLPGAKMNIATSW